MVTFIVRLWMRIRRGIGAEWSAKAAGHFDAAIAGRSAVQGGLARALRLESALVRGWAWGALLLDIDKFYDSIPIPAMVRGALSLRYSPTVLAHGIQ